MGAWRHSRTICPHVAILTNIWGGLVYTYVSSAFVWSHTVQGVDYWSKIHEKWLNAIEQAIDDMPLIDATKNADEPKRKDLNILKRKCKGL